MSARRRRSPVVMVGAIAALAALMLGLVAAGLQTGDSSVSSDETTTTSTTIELNEAGRELVATLEKSRTGTFHARYSVSSTEQPDAVIEIETWRKAGQVRQDTVVTAGGNRLHTVSLALGPDAVRCTRLGESGWSCQSKPGAAPQDAVFDSVREQLGKGPVTVRDDVVDGRPVRCFTLVAEGKQSELCATSAGVAVRVTAPTATMRLVGFDAAVDTAVFTPPAQPVPAD